MNNTIQQITDAMTTFFAEQDQKIADSSVEWAKGRVAELKAFKVSEEAKVLRNKGAFGGYYPKVFAIAGGKTWYHVFDGQSWPMIEEFVRKNAKATAEKRNAKIAKQLTKMGVTEVISTEVRYCPDGFNGVFNINGDRWIKIESILAGGYNVQRLHQRVLVRCG